MLCELTVKTRREGLCQKQNSQGRQQQQWRIITLITLDTRYVSIFAEITLILVSPPDRNDGRCFEQSGNGAVEVSFESRTAQMSALFHTFVFL